MTFKCFVLLVQARPAGDTVNSKADAVDDDKVELEKSNILLMGPTGSGNLFYMPVLYCSLLCRVCDYNAVQRTPHVWKFYLS